MYNDIMLTSKIPKQMEMRGLKPTDLVEAGVASQGLAYKIYNGDTNLTLKTLAKLCQLFGVQFLDDLIAFDPDQP